MKFPTSISTVSIIVALVFFAGGFLTGNVIRGPLTVYNTTTVEKPTTFYQTIYQTVTTEPTPTTPKPGQAGTSRLNPLPRGSKITIGDWTLSVVSLERDAYAKIKSMNMFNSEPKPGNEAILIMLEAKLNLSPTYKGSINSFWLKVVGEKGIVYDHRWDVLEPKIGREVFGGTTIQGYISFDVGRGERGLVLIFRDAWYLALE